MLSIVTAALVAATHPAVLAAATPAAQAAKPATAQARFDAANAAFAGRRCAEAVAAYAALEEAPAIRRNPLARATIAVRKGTCLIGLSRTVEGEAAIRAGLPTLEGKGGEFSPDVRAARLALASAAQTRFDYDAGIAEAERALAASAGYARVTPLLVLSRLTMFDGNGRGLRYAEEARGALAVEKSASKQDVAAVQTQAARALLNAGRAKEAYALLKDSLQKQGGLDTRVNLSEVATRSDLAIAALLTGDKEGARQYLAFTGAGRASETPFSRAASMEAPFCDAAIGLKPSDVAVVEFTLEEDGQVVSAQPIYVTGSRAAAIAFGRAVAGWSWRTEQARAVPLFYRALTRVELRCSTAADVPGPMSVLAEATGEWLGGDAPATGERPGDAAAVPARRAALAGATPGSRAELAALLALATNAALVDAEKHGFAQRAAVLATTLDAPGSVRALTGITALDLGKTSRASREAGLRAVLAEPAVARDALAAAVLRLLIASPDVKRGSRDQAALLDAVIAAPGLPERHPLKVNALLRRANLLAAAGDTAGAEAAFRQTGLAAEQCATLGITPALRSSGASSRDFPMEAMRWGFEGWVRTEFDIGANGRTAAQRALIAYPPFVFDEAATGIARQSRWASSYRPGGSVACAANQMAIRFDKGY